jgi:hypothetical protein
MSCHSLLIVKFLYLIHLITITSPAARIFLIVLLVWCVSGAVDSYLDQSYEHR